MSPVRPSSRDQLPRHTSRTGLCPVRRSPQPVRVVVLAATLTTIGIVSASPASAAPPAYDYTVTLPVQETHVAGDGEALCGTPESAEYSGSRTIRLRSTVPGLRGFHRAGSLVRGPRNTDPALGSAHVHGSLRRQMARDVTRPGHLGDQLLPGVRAVGEGDPILHPSVGVPHRVGWPDRRRRRGPLRQGLPALTRPPEGADGSPTAPGGEPSACSRTVAGRMASSPRCLRVYHGPSGPLAVSGRR
jgi:hypothetical protein